MIVWRLAGIELLTLEISLLTHIFALRKAQIDTSELGLGRFLSLTVLTASHSGITGMVWWF